MKHSLEAGQILHLGVVIALITLIPLVAGLILVRLIGAAPLILALAAAVGVLAGTAWAVRTISRNLDVVGQPADGVNGGKEEGT
jgi:hypothetical protein